MYSDIGINLDSPVVILSVLLICKLILKKLKIPNWGIDLKFLFDFVGHLKKIWIRSQQILGNQPHEPYFWFFMMQN
jgi:hypothetical protein